MERRRFHRAFTATSIQLLDSQGQYLCDASVWDISRGGLLVICFTSAELERLAAVKELKFNMWLPTGLIKGCTEIAWVSLEEKRIGLKFITIENQDGISNLLAFVANQLTEG